MDKIDFKRTMKELYRATSKVGRVKPGEGSFLAVDGQGSPCGEAFQKAIQDLYPVAYTVKFSLKKAGTIDFVVPPLEALWYDDPCAGACEKQAAKRGAGNDLGEEGN